MVARASPILPPSASNASAMPGSRAHESDASIGKRGGNRRMRLVHRHTDAFDLAEAIENGIRHCARRGFDEAMADCAEGLACDFHHPVITDRGRQPVGT